MSGAVFTLGNSVSGSLGLGDAISKLGRVAVTGLTIEQDPDTVNSYLTTRYAGLSAVTSGGVTTFLNPSLVVIPSAYNNGIVYSLHSRQVNTGDFTVTRNTEARRVNSAGRIASIGSGLPRLDYLTSGGTVGTPALLVEPAGTNFARGVELLNTPTPVTASGGITITTGSTDFLAPDGSSATITKYVGGTASGSNFIEYVSSTSVSASGVHTFSAFVKAGATNPLNFCALQLTAYTDASGTGTSYFNLASGTALTAGATIQNYGNGWYRIISAPYTIAAGDLAGSIRLLFAEADNDVNWPASGALNLTVYAWGIQLEAGSVATSYIPTTTGTVSRSTDIISVSGAVSGSIGQTEGTIYAEVDIRSFNNAGILATISDGTASNLLTIYKFTDGKIYFDRTSATQSATTTAGSSVTYTAPTILRIAIGYKSGETRMYINGVAATAEQTATFTFGTLTKVNIGSSRSDGTIFNDRIRAVALYTTRLTNQQLQLLTT
jgi:hypothetical protein